MSDHARSVRYVGRHQAVDVPALGLEHVERGQTIEVTREDAESLLAQPANWRAASPSGRARGRYTATEDHDEGNEPEHEESE